MAEDTSQEKLALEQLAKPYRWKTGINTDGEAVILGKNGNIEWHSFDNQTFAAYTTKSKTIKTLLSLSWITVHQRGDGELRVLFPRSRFTEMAGLLQLRRKRPAPKLETIQKGLKGLQQARRRMMARRRTTVHAQKPVQISLFPP